MSFEDKCDDVLCAVYAEVGEDGEKWVTGFADQLGYTVSEFMTIAKHLERDGHVRYRPAPASGGAIAITGRGIKYANTNV